MRAVTRSCGIVAAVLLVASQAQAQSSPKHEFGVDVGLMSTKFDGSSERLFTIATPLDVRIGFVTQGALMFETRFSFSYASGDDVSVYAFQPGLNALWRLGSGSGMHNQMGAYVTGGGSFALLGASGGGDSESQLQPGFNFGIGTRSSMGSLGFRIEGFFAYHLDAGGEGDPDFIPASTSIGVRLGLSVWH